MTTAASRYLLPASAVTAPRLPGDSMNDTSKTLVAAAEAVVDADAKPVARRTVVAVLRALSDLMDEETTDEGWPGAQDLWLLANDIEDEVSG